MHCYDVRVGWEVVEELDLGVYAFFLLWLEEFVFLVDFYCVGGVVVYGLSNACVGA